MYPLKNDQAMGWALVAASQIYLRVTPNQLLHRLLSYPFDLSQTPISTK